MIAAHDSDEKNFGEAPVVTRLQPLNAPRLRAAMRRLWSRPVCRRWMARPTIVGAGRARRGSAILLVLAVLSILALLAITVSFTARLETSSAENYGVAVQNRMASITGVGPVSTALLRLDPARPDKTIDKGDDNAVAGQPLVPMPQRTRSGAMEAYAATTTAHVQVRDANARVNINAADETLLAGFFSELGRQISQPMNGDAIARAIVNVRLGPDGAPGQRGVDDDAEARPSLADESGAANRTLRPTREVDSTFTSDEVKARAEIRSALVSGVDDPAEYVADIRVAPYGDDVRFASVDSLLDYESIRAAGLTEDVLKQAEPFLTTFSVSRDVWMAPGEETARALLDINRASAQDILDALLAMYGNEGPPPTQLAQYAVNFVDSRDADTIPTQLIGAGGARVLGVERTPMITEVYPDSLSPDDEGDDGQFVELYNPWPQVLDVDGWTLVVDGMPVRLRGKIAPSGYLIVTDDADDRDEKETPGTGSLYDVFGVTADDNRRRVITVMALDIENNSSSWFVELRDAAGNVVDEMQPSPREANAGDAYSLQRENPLVREALRRRATPFGLLSPTTEADATTLMRLSNYPADGAFVAPSDALTVFAGYADQSTGRVDRWAFPVIDAAGGTAALDARVMDIFTVDAAPAPDEWAWTQPAATRATASTGRSSSAKADKNAGLNLTNAPVGTRQGRVNLNTADAVVLQSLPGLGRTGGSRVMAYRSRTGESDLASGLGAAALTRPSDVLMNGSLWVGVAVSDADRLARFRQLEPLLTFNSQSYTVLSQPRLDATDDPATAVANRVQALVATDRGGPETLALMSERDAAQARRVDKRGAKLDAMSRKTSDEAQSANTTGDQK